MGRVLVTAWLAVSVVVSLETTVAAQPRQRTPTPAQTQAASVVPEYAAFLGTLDSTRPDSVPRARAELVRQFADASGERKDAAFRQFMAFSQQVLRSLEQPFFGSPPAKLLDRIHAEVRKGLKEQDLTRDWYWTLFDDFVRSNSPGAVALRKEQAADVAALVAYRSAGFRFLTGEGDWYLVQDYSFLASAADELKLGDLAGWASFRAKEDRQVVAEDAGLQVSWDDVRLRLARWETFARRHPSLPEVATDVEPQIKWLVGVYLLGLDNTPAYDGRYAVPFRSKLVIDPKLRASYERFVAENTDSAYHAVIKGLVVRLAKTNGAPPNDIVPYLTSQLRDPYFKFWIDSLARRLRR